MSLSRKTAPEGYRPCVGAVVFNAAGLVFVGSRADLPEDEPFRWQLPQGGIDKGEKPEQAARRELFEETGIQSVELISSTDTWLTYDFPEDLLGKRFKKYRGQAQLWFAYRFIGDESEIDIYQSGHAEFHNWDWVSIKSIPELIVPFKRHVYESIVSTFGSLAGGSVRLGD